jgi:hypothetical protein
MAGKVADGIQQITSHWSRYREIFFALFGEINGLLKFSYNCINRNEFTSKLAMKRI